MKNLFDEFSPPFSILNKIIPIKVTFIVNHLCNLDCLYCNVKSLMNDSMTLSEIREMIDEFKDMGMRQMNFIGGEPLLRDDLGEILTYCKNKGIITCVHSNGMLIPRVDETILSNIDTFITCVNGPKDIHEATRGKNTYQKTLNAIKLMKERNAKVIVDFILSKLNTEPEVLNNVLALSKELDFLVNFQPVNEHKLVNADSETVKNLKLSQQELRRVVQYILKHFDTHRNINSKEYFMDLISQGYSYFDRCYIGIFCCVVNAGGTIHRCYKYLRESDGESGLVLGWKKAFLQMQVKLGDCRTCQYTMHIEDNYSLISKLKKLK
jgi:MoaA/NifB/PqqE/SkfB family radical SAM enzyme